MQYLNKQLHTIESLVQQIDKGVLVVPNCVEWDVVKQSRAIENILFGFPVPSIFLLENTREVLPINSSIQFVKTIVNFVDDKFVLTNTTDGLLNLKFNNLPLKKKRQFNKTIIECVVMLDTTISIDTLDKMCFN